jgi:hypothetical protein
MSTASLFSGSMPCGTKEYYDALRTDCWCAELETEEIAERESVADRDGVTSKGGEVNVDPHPWQSLLSADRSMMRSILVILPLC